MPQTAERRRQYGKELRLTQGPKLRARAADWRSRNREYLKVKNTKRRLEKRAMCLAAAARIRARKKGITFDLSSSDIGLLQAAINAGKCQVSGVALSLEGPRSATSPSLDRIEPGKGYVAGNVRIVCHALNAGMGDWGEAELKRIVAAWLLSGNAICPVEAA